MELEVVTIGTELVLGFTLDTNALDIATALTPLGVMVVRVTTVGDDGAVIRNALTEALERTGLVIVTGGLGPTRDDITKKTVAAIYGAPLRLDSKYLAVLERRFEKFGRGPMPVSNRSQADVPAGAEVLPNRRGTAPGLWMEGDPGITVMLPGVPREMRGLIEEHVLPRLRARLKADEQTHVTCSRTLRTTGVSESKLADQLDGMERQIDPVTIAYLPGISGVDLRLTAWQLPADIAQRGLHRAAECIEPILGPNFYGVGKVDLAAIVLERLKSKGAGLAVAESCTGGEVGSRITAVPGSSDVFAGGVICYSNSSKIHHLGVPEKLLEVHGAVSEQVAKAMLDGVCHMFDVDAGVAVTGIAGPGGGSDAKPVGTVCLAARLGSRSRVLKRWFPGGRQEVRQRSAQAALDLLRRLAFGL